MSASSQSLRSFLSLRMNSIFITSGPDYALARLGMRKHMYVRIFILHERIQSGGEETYHKVDKSAFKGGSLSYRQRNAIWRFSDGPMKTLFCGIKILSPQKIVYRVKLDPLWQSSFDPLLSLYFPFRWTYLFTRMMRWKLTWRSTPEDQTIWIGLTKTESQTHRGQILRSKSSTISL